MNRKTKQLLTANNELEKELTAENNRAMTDIVVYLRAANITEYQQELLRRDITQMLLEGERRGEGAKSVIGEDYRIFCDNVLSEIPKRPVSARLLSAASTAGTCLGILAAIWLAGELLLAFTGQGEWFRLTVTVGDLVSAAGITLLAAGLVELICRHSFDQDFPRSKLWFVLLFVLVFLCIAAVIFLRFPLFAVHPVLVLAAIAALLLFSYFSE